ncbi:hypothetical protein RIF29_25064 [Crotalaria pallida]|uniref:Uncharacterized protein n=1 Tax=Crotalaria pallida TaxID=3830 RepID=A0AAN9ENB7_CROPI
MFAARLNSVKVDLRPRTSRVAENPEKRKQIWDSNNNTESANESHPKKPFNSAKKPFKSVNNKKSFKSDNKKPFKFDIVDDKDKKSAAPATGRERRLHAKELAEARKKKRKRHFTLEEAAEKKKKK